MRAELALVALAALAIAVACGGAAEPADAAGACPHHQSEVFDDAGRVTLVDATAAEYESICAYLAWLRARAPADAGAD